MVALVLLVGCSINLRPSDEDNQHRHSCCSKERDQSKKCVHSPTPRFINLQARSVSGDVGTGGGWSQGVGPHIRENTLRNYLAQATGGDILRLAMIALDDAGYELLATNLDSILVEVQLEDVDEASTEIARIMSEAGAELLQGHRLRVDTHVVRPGESLLPGDATSRRFWEVFEQIRQNLEGGNAVFGIWGTPLPAE